MTTEGAAAGLAPGSAAISNAVADTLTKFRAAMRPHGIIPPEHINADGHIHRCDVEGSSGKRDGSYLLHLDRIPAGGFQNWQNGGGWVNWCSRDVRTLTRDERAHLRVTLDNARRQRDEETARRYNEAAAEAAGIWKAAVPADPDHPYLTRKGVQPHGLRLYQGKRSIGGMECDGAVIAQLMLDGSIQSLEFIAPNGEKRFLKGGRVKGCYSHIGTAKQVQEQQVLCIAEGWATAASVHACTGYAVVVAFASGNLLPVARHMSNKFSAARLILCADDDYRTDKNPGITEARKAAAIVSGSIAIPDFGSSRPDGAKDFNDLAACRGREVVKEQIEKAVRDTQALSNSAQAVNLPSRDSNPELQENAEFSRALAEPVDENSTSIGSVTVDDFYSYLPSHHYIFVPTRALWPASSVNVRSKEPIGPDGKPATKKVARMGKGGELTFEEVPISVAEWLDKHRPVEQMTWAPGAGPVIRDKLVDEGGWIERPGCTTFNLYRPPTLIYGNADLATKWVQHVKAVYGAHAEYIIRWLAHRVQRPSEKINHALVLGGKQGIGKDTIFEPVKYAIGPWNFIEVTPLQMLGRFNGFLKSIILRVSEARDLGDTDRYAFYEHMKTYTAAPPDVNRCDEKNLREHSVFNVMGVIITTNNKQNGIYLPPDDRRHYVAWSDLNKEDFESGYWREMYGWYAAGGIGHVAAYLARLDLHDFDPKAPPPKTAAFWEIVQANAAPEDAELADVLDKLQSPEVVTIAMLADKAPFPFSEWLSDRKNSRQIPHRLEAAGYTAVRNESAKDGLWSINGKRCTVYARQDISIRDRHLAVKSFIQSKECRWG